MIPDITLSFVLFIDQIGEKAKLETLDKKLDVIIGELDTIDITEWLARACVMHVQVVPYTSELNVDLQTTNRLKIFLKTVK